jgi:hypothetical protein
MGWYWLDSTGSRFGPLYEDGNGPAGFMKYLEILSQLGDLWLSVNDPASCSWSDERQVKRTEVKRRNKLIRKKGIGRRRIIIDNKGSINPDSMDLKGIYN